jgi:leucyl-tRNA synthetase
MEKTFISFAYIYPICPLNINHARMFIIGDIIARNARKKGENVFFPVAMHYSGNSAQNISKIFAKFFLNDNVIDNYEEKKIFNLYKNIYNTPTPVLKSFIHPLNILDFYSQEILWELKSLDVSCDYEYFYTTKHKDFSTFVNTIVSIYKENNLLVNNKKGDLSLDYNNDKWKKKIFQLLNRTEFIQSFHKNNVASAIKDVRNDWGLLRRDGFGVSYNKKWIIDPMFDSEVLTIFDLYIRFKDVYKNESINVEDLFRNLFKALKNKEKSEDILINKIISFLPCDVFICEEHLKNWVAKKLYSESFLLNKKYQTKKYFIIGMGFLDGRQMSASKGHAVLAKDLIDRYGPTKARLIILLGGGHPSKMYNYDKTLPIQADKLLNNFISHYTHLLSIIDKRGYRDRSQEESPTIESIKSICNNIEKNIQKGYYRQAIIEFLSILPKEYYKSPTIKTARLLISVYKKYIDILLPSLLNNFVYYKKR